MADNRYFATLEGKEFGDAVMERVTAWNKHMSSAPIFQKMRAAGRNYFGTDEQGTSGARISLRGDAGQVASLKTNQLRQAVQGVLTFLLAEQPALKPVARATDASAQAQAQLAKSRYDHYAREEGLESRLFEAAEMCLVLSLGWVRGRWDDTATSEDKMEGDLKFSSHLPVDVLWDVEFAGGVEEAPWFILRTYVNKYELAAEYLARAEAEAFRMGDAVPPDFMANAETVAKRITSAGPDRDVTKFRADMCSEFANRTAETGDIVPVYEFFHAPTLAVQGGRYAKLISADVELVPGDGSAQPLGYDSIPLWPIYSSRQFGSAWTHTSTFDALAIQRALDILTSIPVSNQRMLGLQAIAVPMGCDFDIREVSKGFPIIHYDPKFGKPEAIQWAKTAPEVFAFRSELKGELGQIIGGLNDVSRGMEQRDLSGAALVMLDAVSARFSKPFLRAYMSLLKRVAMFVIKNLRERVREPRMGRISGGADSTVWQSWKGSDLEAIETVDVEPVSPLSQSQAGRIEIAENLMQHGAVNPKQYIGLIDTGKLEVMTDAPETLRLHVKRENENLAKGLPVVVSPTDNHPAHIQEHAAVLASDDVRGNPKLSAGVLNHIQEHLTTWEQTSVANPALLAALGIPPAPMAAPMMPPGGPPAGPGPNPPAGPPPATPGAPRGPGLPTNPKTGRPYDPANPGA